MSRQSKSREPQSTIPTTERPWRRPETGTMFPAHGTCRFLIFVVLSSLSINATSAAFGWQRAPSLESKIPQSRSTGKDSGSRAPSVKPQRRFSFEDLIVRAFDSSLRTALLRRNTRSKQCWSQGVTETVPTDMSSYNSDLCQCGANALLQDAVRTEGLIPFESN